MLTEAEESVLVDDVDAVFDFHMAERLSFTTLFTELTRKRGHVVPESAFRDYDGGWRFDRAELRNALDAIELPKEQVGRATYYRSWSAPVPRGVEIAFRIPGRGSFRRRRFETQKAAESFIERLLKDEGDDVEVIYRDD